MYKRHQPSSVVSTKINKKEIPLTNCPETSNERDVPGESTIQNLSDLCSLSLTIKWNGFAFTPTQ